MTRQVEVGRCDCRHVIDVKAAKPFGSVLRVTTQRGARYAVGWLLFCEILGPGRRLVDMRLLNTNGVGEGRDMIMHCMIDPMC